MADFRKKIKTRLKNVTMESIKNNKVNDIHPYI